jgi:hypothetical protein
LLLAMVLTCFSVGFLRANYALRRGDLEAVTSNEPPEGLRFGLAGPEPKLPESFWVTAARWSARVLGTLLLAILALFVVGEGLPPMGLQPEGVQLSFAAMGLMALGLIIGWKREGTAALLIASGWTLWHIAEGRISLNAFQAPLPVAALYGFCWWATRGRKTLVVLATAAGLAAVLGVGLWLCPSSVFVRGTVRDALSGAPIPKAELTLLRRAQSPGGKEQGPNARADQQGRFALYVGWYVDQKPVTVAAAGYAPLTTNLGPRALGQRTVSRDFQLQPADAQHRASEGRHRRFVRLVVDPAAMTFEGQPTTWEQVSALLEQVPDRTNTVLECAVTSDQITVQQQNEWSVKCTALAQALGFEYASFIGVHPLRSKGTPQLERLPPD